MMRREAMFTGGKPNPFQVLRLPTSATTKEITERGEELSATAEPDEQLLYRWAVEELITHPSVRLLHELYEVPDTNYEDQDWENFLRKYKRNPIRRATALEPGLPQTLEDFNPGALMELLLDGLLAVPEVEITPAMLAEPWQPDPDPKDPPLEVQDVIFG
jgi:Asp-tRNA(Asn)/Glu-tRNA(Gln) amidotransferase A subunit family amidase